MIGDDAEGPRIRFASISPQQREQRLADARRLRLEAERRAAELHAEWFGDGTDQIATWVDMPLSGTSFGWRADGYVAEWPTAALEELPSRDIQLFPDGEPLWKEWDPERFGIGLDGEVTPGDSATPTWWLASGVAFPNDTVACWLAEDRDVPVTRLGCWWIAEFVSRPQTVFVQVNDDDVDSVQPDRIARLRGPAPYPYSLSTVNPRA